LIASAPETLFLRVQVAGVYLSHFSGTPFTVFMPNRSVVQQLFIYAIFGMTNFHDLDW